MSGVILLIGALAIGGRGINLGIDFTSGTRISVGLERPATVAQVRSVMSAAGAGDATIQQVRGNRTLGANGFQISSHYLDRTRLDQVQTQLQSRFGIAANGTDINKESIGPTFGSQVAHSAVIAIIASLIVISLYVALRFDWKFSVPVLIALAHDLLITSGIYALTGRTVTTDTVAALLTILGYSMYDTIIVFDRVRENIPRMPRAAFSQIVNRSMSEVLTRSLATTSVTLLPILALLVFGGTTLKDFAFALLIGVASGAYSSIFIASPVLMHWKEREPHYRARRAHLLAEFGTVPAYAEASADIEPERARKRRAGRLTEPEAETVSSAEFEQMKRELGIDEEPVTAHTSTLSQRLAHSRAEAPRSQKGAPKPKANRSNASKGSSTPAAGGQPTAPAAASPGPPAAAPQPPARAAEEPLPSLAPDAEPEIVPAPDVPENEGVAPAPKPKRPKARSRNRRHGRR
jgi:SecD/SecF fusion protein